jgi:hypothetical protein
VAATAAVTRRCGLVVGYVHDCYNNNFFGGHAPSNCPRTPAAGPPWILPGKPPIEDDIGHWFAAYPNVAGIFIDQVDADNVNRASDLKKIVDRKYAEQWKNFPGRSAVTVLNPGRIPSVDFIAATDPAIVVIQEQSHQQFRTNWPPPGLVENRDGGDQSGSTQSTVVASL